MFNTNIRIVKGSDLPEPNKPNGTNWTFTDIDFSKVEIVNINSNSGSTAGSMKITPKKLKDLMNGRDMMLVIYPNQRTGFKKLQKKLSTQAYEKYKNLPCAVITPNKDALMTAPIIPFGLGSNSNNYFDNGLVFPTERGFSNDINGNRQAKYYSNSCNWIPSFASNSDLQNLLSEDSNGDTLFGVRSCIAQGAGYIDMSACKNKNYDANSTAARRYEAVTPLAKGSAAICYNFVDCDPPQKGKIDSPLLLIRLSSNSSTNAIEFAVGPSSKASARVGSDVTIGELGGGGQAQGIAQPPQAQAIGGNTVFMYPLYNGFAFTGNVEQGGMFVKYSEFETYYNMIEIYGGPTTTEIETDWEQNPYSKMQWFPALLQETSNPNNMRLGLRKEVKTGTKITPLKPLKFTAPSVEWWCSTGKFAYCPLWFVPEMTFDLYFKGEFGSNSLSTARDLSSNYYVFPIGATVNTKNKEADIWDNFNENGAKCLHGSSDIKLMAKADISNSQQPIYRVHFSYEAKTDIPVFPLEMFGCVIASKYQKPRFTLKNGNGDFNNHPQLKNIAYHQEFNLSFANTNSNEHWMDFITSIHLQNQFQGPSGTITLDEYAMKRPLQNVKLQQCIGAVSLKIQEVNDIPQHYTKYDTLSKRMTASEEFDANNIFKGYVLDIRNQVSEGGHTIDCSLQGIQKKLSDMKLICAPYWDGDKLEMICQYFEQYCNIRICMINYTCTNYSQRKMVGEQWISDNHRMIGDVYAAAPDFRVPRSFEYSKPSVDFPTSTNCLQALNSLAEFVSCAMVIQPNGEVNFFELNDMGVPYYVQNQTNVVSFEPKDIISLNISPYLENKYNSFITFGLLKKRSKKTNRVQGVSVNPGIITTFIDSNSYSTSVNFPWSRPNVAVENGSLTPSELRYVHANNVLFGIADTYQGQVTVYGNTKINHLYQRVNICGVPFFVQSIDHEIDLSTKTWTSSYGLTYFDGKGPKYDKEHNTLGQNETTP